MLWNPKVRCIHLPEMNSIPRLNKWVEKIENEPARPSCQEAFNVLKDERTRAVLGDESGEH
jgi:hypothetical protein